VTSRRHQAGLALAEVLLVLAVVISIVAVIAFGVQHSTQQTDYSRFEARAVELRDAIQRDYMAEQDITTVTAERLFLNRVIPTGLRGPSVATPLLGPTGTTMSLNHLTLPGEPRPSVLRFTFQLEPTGTDAAMRDACRQWVATLLPHFPYLRVNRTTLATPTPLVVDVIPSGTVETAITVECASASVPPSIGFGLLL